MFFHFLRTALYDCSSTPGFGNLVAIFTFFTRSLSLRFWDKDIDVAVDVDDARFVLYHALVEPRFVARLGAAAVEGGGHGAAGAVGAVEK